MRHTLGRLALAGALLALAAGLVAQNRLYYFNGVPYTWPSSQGATGTVLTNDGSGGLSWATAASGEGLWSGSIILSSVTCPTGFTRFSSADDRFLRAASTAGNPGGSDTHTHTLSGSTASQSVTISGSTGSTGVSISGSSSSTDISHTHSVTPNTSTLGSGGTSFLTSATISSGGGSHSHGAGSLAGSSHSHSDGSLAGASHSHAVGTLATDAGSSVPAYYSVILCEKD